MFMKVGDIIKQRREGNTSVNAIDDLIMVRIDGIDNFNRIFVYGTEVRDRTLNTISGYVLQNFEYYIQQRKESKKKQNYIA